MSGFDIGQRIAGRYEIVELIAASGNNLVYRVRSEGRELALKTPKDERVGDREAMARFEKEIEIVRRMPAHANIVPVIDFGKEEGRPYLIYSLISDPTAHRFIQEQGPLPEELATRLLTDAAEGLHHAHKHDVVHRDISFTNAFICGDPPVARLFDFGEGLVSEIRGTFTQEGHARGTSGFMPPEVHRSEVRRNPVKGDIYSLGALGFYLLIGGTPEPGAHMASYNRKRLRDSRADEELPPVSGAMARLIEKMLHPNPKKRPENVKKVLDELSGVREKRARTSWMGLGAILGALVVLTIVSFLALRPDTGPVRGLMGLWIAMIGTLGYFALEFWKGLPRAIRPVLLLLVTACIGIQVFDNWSHQEKGPEPPVIVEPKNETSEHDNLWNEGEEHWLLKNHPKAHELFLSSLARKDDQVRRQTAGDRFAGLGYRSYAEKKWADAEKYFTMALDFLPDPEEWKGLREYAQGRPRTCHTFPYEYSSWGKTTILLPAGALAHRGT